MQIEYLPQARLDITQAIDYLTNKLMAPQAAEDLLNEFSSVIQNISEFPYAFPLYRTAEPMRSEVRYAPVRNYVVYYVVLTDRVQIRRFLHGRQRRQTL